MQSTHHQLTQINANRLQQGLTAKWLGKKIIHRETITSTQTIAHQLARENTVHGTIVIADEQTSGRGRMDRTFQSVKHKGIWMSIILRPNISPQQASQLTLLTATVLADLFTNDIGIQSHIKWPNDILVGERKCAGILTEMQTKKDKIEYIIIGIGLNVNQDHSEVYMNHKYQATSLRLETGKMWDLKTVFQKILINFEQTYEEFMVNGFPPIKHKWESYGFKIGEIVSVNTLAKNQQATLLGLSEDGALLIQTNTGKTEKIYSAEIDWFKEDHQT